MFKFPIDYNFGLSTLKRSPSLIVSGQAKTERLKTANVKALLPQTILVRV